MDVGREAALRPIINHGDGKSEAFLESEGEDYFIFPSTTYPDTMAQTDPYLLSIYSILLVWRCLDGTNEKAKA
ncbi:hypothetical protein CUN61_20635 [Pseudomonas arsenicoxydans]|uniref:Uncharacterized protein n=1 Tax=Pseudomonas arsenicoxydans TaxID=702115 RepID=A0A4P6G549_9PSED|nr:hypothetical protein CUN61_20635 [Pseudomonas arsenicoxydans]